MAYDNMDITQIAVSTALSEEECLHLTTMNELYNRH